MAVPLASMTVRFASMAVDLASVEQGAETGGLLNITNVKSVTDDQWQSEIVE